eukprot:2276645-Rhodomonas_salina.3
MSVAGIAKQTRRTIPVPGTRLRTGEGATYVNAGHSTQRFVREMCDTYAGERTIGAAVVPPEKSRADPCANIAPPGTAKRRVSTGKRVANAVIEREEERASEGGGGFLEWRQTLRQSRYRISHRPAQRTRRVTTSRHTLGQYKAQTHRVPNPQSALWNGARSAKRATASQCAIRSGSTRQTKRTHAARNPNQS